MINQNGCVDAQKPEDHQDEPDSQESSKQERQQESRETDFKGKEALIDKPQEDSTKAGEEGIDAGDNCGIGASKTEADQAIKSLDEVKDKQDSPERAASPPVVKDEVKSEPTKVELKTEPCPVDKFLICNSTIQGKVETPAADANEVSGDADEAPGIESQGQSQTVQGNQKVEQAHQVDEDMAESSNEQGPSNHPDSDDSLPSKRHPPMQQPIQGQQQEADQPQSDKLSKIQDFERIDNQMSFEDDNHDNHDNRMVMDLQKNLKIVSDSMLHLNEQQVTGESAPSETNMDSKEADLPEAKSESNLSTPEQASKSQDETTNAYKVKQYQPTEPQSSSSLQEDIELIDNNDATAKGAAGSGKSPPSAQKPQMKYDESCERAVRDLQRLLNAEEYISENVNKDKSFDLEVEFEMGHIHKQEISPKLEELIIHISSPTLNAQDNQILPNLQIIDLYKLRACLDCDQVKKLPVKDRLLVFDLQTKVNKRIAEMDQLNPFEDQIMENDDDKNLCQNMWGQQTEVQDLDLLSAGDGQENGGETDDQAMEQAQQNRQQQQQDGQYDEMLQDRNSNGSSGGNYMDVGTFGHKKEKTGSPTNGGGSIQNLVEFNWDPLENFRAKLYTLDSNGRWHDLGTGHFRIDYVSQIQQYKMTLLQEQDSSIDLLKNEIIEPHVQYNRQRETIITWSDKQRDQDLAVSFQTNLGAQYTWKKICQILYIDPHENSQASQIEPEEPAPLSVESLPRLADELKAVSTIEPEAKQEFLEHFLGNENQNLTKLGQLFDECESEFLQRKNNQGRKFDTNSVVNQEENLLYFFYIYKGLIQLNDQRMLETIMSENYFLQTFGALEWDPDGLEVADDGLNVQNSGTAGELGLDAQQMHDDQLQIQDMEDQAVQGQDPIQTTGNKELSSSLEQQDQNAVDDVEQLISSLAEAEDVMPCQGGEEDLEQPNTGSEENVKHKATGQLETNNDDERDITNADDERSADDFMVDRMINENKSYAKQSGDPLGYGSIREQVNTYVNNEHNEDEQQSSPTQQFVHAPRTVRETKIKKFKLFNDQEVIGRKIKSLPTYKQIIGDIEQIDTTNQGEEEKDENEEAQEQEHDTTRTSRRMAMLSSCNKLDDGSSTHAQVHKQLAQMNKNTSQDDEQQVEDDENQGNDQQNQENQQSKSQPDVDGGQQQNQAEENADGQNSLVLNKSRVRSLVQSCAQFANQYKSQPTEDDQVHLQADEGQRDDIEVDELEEGQREDKQERQLLGNSTLNYRDFLQNKVKFKKVVDFSQFYHGQDGVDQQKQYQNRQMMDDQHNGSENNTCLTVDIEERININYRLQYLKDSVMARYIDDPSLKVINQLIMSNNREIVQFIFGIPPNGNDSQGNQYANASGFGVLQSQKHGRSYGVNKDNQTVKDYVVELIKSKTDISGRFQAIEFMIELCQVLKSLQFQPGMLGGASSFLYGSGGMGFNNRQVLDQLNQANLIGLLAETLGIFVPTYESLEKHLSIKCDDDRENLIAYYKEKNPEINNEVIEQLLDENRHCGIDNDISCSQKRDGYVRQTTPLDQMKINSLEIIISFYQSAHLPMPDINKFALGQDQLQRGLPFLNQLVQHLIYSPEQGIKVQICDFFKSLLDGEQTYFNHLPNKESLYKNVIKGFVEFLNFFSGKKWNEGEKSPDEPAQYELYRNLEYSTYLILQILNKVTAEHRYPFKIFVVHNDVVQTVASVAKLDSNLLNIEIVKFYKSLLRSKDPSYIMMIIEKNLFYPVMHIFKQSYRERNPPMIQSTIRDLFETIFRNNISKVSPQKNEFFNPKLVDHLTRQNTECKNVIFNPKYAEIFDKYSLKQSGSAINDLIDGKIVENADDEEIGSAKNSRDTDDIDSPFSALSNDGIADELIGIGTLGIGDRFTKQGIYDSRGDRTFKSLQSSMKSHQQPFKTSHIQRIKFGVDRSNSGDTSKPEPQSIADKLKDDDIERDDNLLDNQANDFIGEKGSSFDHNLTPVERELEQIKKIAPYRAKNERGRDYQLLDDQVQDSPEQDQDISRQERQGFQGNGLIQDLNLRLNENISDEDNEAEVPSGMRKRQQDDAQDFLIGGHRLNEDDLFIRGGPGSEDSPTNQKNDCLDHPWQMTNNHRQSQERLHDQGGFDKSKMKQQKVTQGQQQMDECDILGQILIDDQHVENQQRDKHHKNDSTNAEVRLEKHKQGLFESTTLMSIGTKALNNQRKAMNSMRPSNQSEMFQNIERIELERTSDDDEQQIGRGFQGEEERQDRDEPENENQLQDYRDKRINIQASGSCANQDQQRDQMVEITAGQPCDEEETEEQDQNIVQENQRGYQRIISNDKSKDFAQVQQQFIENIKKSRETVVKNQAIVTKVPAGRASPIPGNASNCLSPRSNRKSAQDIQFGKHLLQFDKLKAENDISSRSVGSPRSQHSQDAIKGGTQEKPKSQYFMHSQHSQKRQTIKGSQSAEISKQNNSSSSANALKDGSAAGISQFDKVSNSSSEHLLGIMGEEDLAKDLGMFDIDISGLKQPSNSQNAKSQVIRPQPYAQKALHSSDKRPFQKLQGFSKSSFLDNMNKLVPKKRKRSIDDDYAQCASEDIKDELQEDMDLGRGSKSPSSDRLQQQKDENSLFGPTINNNYSDKANAYQKFKMGQSYQQRLTSTPIIQNTKRRSSSGEKTKTSPLFGQSQAKIVRPSSQPIEVEQRIESQSQEQSSNQEIEEPEPQTTKTVGQKRRIDVQSGQIEAELTECKQRDQVESEPMIEETESREEAEQEPKIESRDEPNEDTKLKRQRTDEGETLEKSSSEHQQETKQENKEPDQST